MNHNYFYQLKLFFQF